MTIASFQDFWNLVVDVWQHGVFGIHIADSLFALGIFLLFIMLRNILTRFILSALQRAASRTKTDIDNQILEVIRAPVRFIPIVMGIFFATSALNVGEDVEAFFNHINRSLVTFTLFWTLHRIVSPIGGILMHSRGILTPAMVDWIIKSAKVAFILLGSAAILEIWGIAVAPIIAGLGLFGVAVALGAQDLFKNLISGLFVIGERRFHPGDWISVDGVVEGDVEEIGFRTTKIRRFDKAPVYVPNSKLSDNAVTNFQRMTYRRIKWIIGLEYRTTGDQLRRIRDGIEAYILESDDFAKPEMASTFVRIDAFSANSIDILLYCFTRTTKWGEWLEVKERLAFKIKDIVEEAGAGFAFPSRSLYVETMPDAAESFPQSANKADTAAQSLTATNEIVQKNS
ncbi:MULTISPECIES: mechanosensitive ion channel family protein [unclassified Iodidimonas]|jgi:MscS family membrane protein|uniref:mechanosensitive ion channel family protein n=1 Tax=unclassified Iodidimonas TaxID=2626145 RepID=UPI002482BCF9|nr:MULTISPECIES: mechanosensitive ion channel family protein [unclassified Iodidimonas]